MSAVKVIVGDGVSFDNPRHTVGQVECVDYNRPSPIFWKVLVDNVTRH